MFSMVRRGSRSASAVLPRYSVYLAVDTSSTRVVGLNNAGAREIAAALAKLFQ